MPASRVSERLNRLAGGGGGGGGLPLPHLFSVILNELLDNGTADTARLAEITQAAMSFKAETVHLTWPSFDALTADVLAQMEDCGVIVPDGGAWQLGPAFRTGEFLEIIPARKDSRRDGTTVWGQEERETLSRQSMVEGDAGALISRPNAIKHDVVAQLRESAQAVGPQYPILTDRTGRVIDGHHRDQADPNWPRQVARRRDGKTLVETEAEMLALVRDLDIHRPPLSAKTRSEIDRLLGELAGTNQIKRDRVEAELKRDASRSNREIAEIVGVANSFVLEVRNKLLSESSIHDYQFKGGRGARAGKHSASCWCGEGEAEVKPEKDPSQQDRPKQRATTRKWDDPALLKAAREAVLTGESADSLASRFGVVGTTASRAMIFTRGQMAHDPPPVPALIRASSAAPEHEHTGVCEVCGLKFRG